MPSSRGRFPKCGHRGFGVACRRCLAADTLDARAEHETLAARTREAALLGVEALRLRGPQMRRARRPTGVAPPEGGPLY